MYLDHYGLSCNPFQLAPDVTFFFASRGHRRGLATITYGLSKREGFVVVTGHVGAGKTLLIETMLAREPADDTVHVTINTTQLEADNLLELIALELGLDLPRASKAVMLRELGALFRRLWDQGQRVLLIVDEVQNLPPAALEELRMLSNFQVGAVQLVQMLLVGQPEFRVRLAEPQCEQIRQRVTATYHLTPLSAGEVPVYIEHRLDNAGWPKGKPLFSEEACRLIFQETGGVPRAINRLCDRTLLYGYLEGLTQIGAGAVEAVLADMREENLAFTGTPVETTGLSGAAQPRGEPLASNRRAKLDMEGASRRSPFRSDPPGGADHRHEPAYGADDGAALVVEPAPQAAFVAPAQPMITCDDHLALVSMVTELRDEVERHKVKLRRIMDLVAEGERLGRWPR
ncbi:putative secretion ATPase (PEP-CTERM system associated) [Rhodothalassium salexigens DSM 2132]|uniref:Putative secretion ATPase (PEP-CTERM system associated) n=1 Tax=Rhodothalassium salexigens DSM 2132 TaxID=1188247 RepID=A0A4R2PG39_RHOSA|nr:AAA family ATPase [Rhodothalassium salexigens]MBB4212038.1 putative secretion ATPase (PEP-CTERM system associated) [Rhodothalassium salexigens DSM 2132]MBK1638107.1 hypothetical protein [Rhodothalassium salexigens DSM 2132]TCP32915.1 putative secretion ATPase (PEP-CTERM system associated) [Rhodothalassium salexigens DSM 2132]